MQWLLIMEKALREKLRNGKFSEVPATRSKTMSAIKGKGNKTTEIKFRFALVRAGISGWKMNQTDILGKPDFYFPKNKLAVFIDGCFWHGCPKCGHIPKTNTEYWREKITRNKKRDNSTTRKLRYRNFKVLRFWEHELKNDLPGCVRKLVNIIK